MQKHYKLALIFFVTIFLYSCNEEKNSSSSIPFVKEAEIIIINSKSDTLRFDVELATTPYQQAQGLMNRYSLEDNQGMFFIFNNNIQHSFWMKNTYISLDIIFVNEDFKVLQIHENAFPLSEEAILSNEPCKYVLEIKGGLSSKLNIMPNDSIQLIKKP